MDCTGSYLAYKRSCASVIPVRYEDTTEMTLDELTEYVSSLLADAVSVAACRDGRISHRDKCIPQEQWDEGHQYQIDRMSELLSEYEEQISKTYNLLESRIITEEQVEDEVVQAVTSESRVTRIPVATVSRRVQKKETPEQKQQRILEPVIIRYVQQERMSQLLRRALSTPSLIPMIVREAIAQKKTNVLKRMLPVISYSKGLTDTQREQILRDILAYAVQNNQFRFVRDFLDVTHWPSLRFMIRDHCLMSVYYYPYLDPSVALRYKAMAIYSTILTSTYDVFETHDIDLSCSGTHDTIIKLSSYNVRNTPDEKLMNMLADDLSKNIGTRITINDVLSVVGKSILDVYCDAFLYRIENTDYLTTLSREELQNILDKLKIIENRAGHLEFVKNIFLPSSRIRTLVEMRKRPVA